MTEVCRYMTWLRSGTLPVIGIFLLPSLGAGQEPMSLERAISFSLANSSVIDASEQQLASADQQVREAWGSALPDIRANASYQRNLRVQEAFLPAIIFDPNASPDELIAVRFGADNQWSAGLTVDQPLFQMDVFTGVGAAGRFREFQREILRGTRQQVVTTVRRAYLDGLLAEERLRVAEKSADRVRRTLEETRARVRAGLVGDYDVLRIEVELANIESELLQAENAVSAARRNLAVEMGTEPGEEIELEGRLSEMNIDHPDSNTSENLALLNSVGLPLSVRPDLRELMEISVRRRSDLRQQRLNVTLEEARLNVERSNYFPSISVFANYNVTAQESGSPSFFGETERERTTAAASGVRVELPLFNGFAREARIQQSRAAVRQNEVQLERMERVAENDIRTQLDRLEETQARVATQNRAVVSARRGFEIASAEYRAGVGSQLQVTDAEEALRQAEFSHAQAVYDYLVARSELERAVGLVPDEGGSLSSRSGLE